MSAHIAGHPVSYSTYTNWGCRCAGCRAEWASYFKRRTEERSAADVLKKHGLATTYRNYKCRCDECRAAWTAYRRDLRQRQRAVS